MRQRPLALTASDAVGVLAIADRSSAADGPTRHDHTMLARTGEAVSGPAWDQAI
jgi:hypothetical protein